MKSHGQKDDDWAEFERRMMLDYLKSGVRARSAIPEDMCRVVGVEMVENEELSWHGMMAEPLSQMMLHSPSDPFLGQRSSRHPSPLDTVALTSEITALRKEIAELKEERRRDKADLTQWVRDIDQKIDELRNLQGFDDREVPTDPHTAWIEANRAILESYPDTWIALDPEHGVVFFSKDADEFAAQLSSLSPDEREKVMALHTAMYV